MSFYKKYIKKPLKKLGNNKFVMNLISAFLYTYAKFVGLTTRWHTEGVDKFHQLARENNGVILVIWHGRAMMLPFFKESDSLAQKKQFHLHYSRRPARSAHDYGAFSALLCPQNRQADYRRRVLYPQFRNCR